MWDNPDIYRQVLNEYFKENQDTLKKLSHSIREKRYADSIQIVHKVKSSSGSIGAKTLYELAKKLQKALNDRDEDDIAFMYKDFEWMFTKLLEEISVLKTANADDKD